MSAKKKGSSERVIDPTKVFSHLPAGMDQRQLWSFIGIRYACEMYNNSYLTLVNILNEIGTQVSKNEIGTNHYPAVMVHVWSMVDSANRLRVLLNKTPRLKKSDPDFQVHFRKLKPVEDLRNPIQHLDTEFIRRAKDVKVTPEPVWGSVGWVSVTSRDPLRLRSYVLVPGSLEGETSTPLVNPLGRTFTGDLDHITLSAYGSQISLSEVHLAIIELYVGLAGGLWETFQEAIAAGSTLPADGLFAMDMDVGAPPGLSASE